MNVKSATDNVFSQSLKFLPVRPYSNWNRQNVPGRIRTTGMHFQFRNSSYWGLTGLKEQVESGPQIEGAKDKQIVIVCGTHTIAKWA